MRIWNVIWICIRKMIFNPLTPFPTFDSLYKMLNIRSVRMKGFVILVTYKPSFIWSGRE
jgi:hypothetical protein